MSAAEQVAGLRALADLIEQNPDLAADIRYALTGGSGLLAMPLHNRAVTDQRARLALWARAARQHGATTTKDADGERFEVVAHWPGALKITVMANRSEVCERVVTGTETVTRTVPDPAVTVPTVEVTETVETVEWVCQPLLADERAEDPR